MAGAPPTRPTCGTVRGSPRRRSARTTGRSDARMARTDDVGKIGWIDLTVGDATRVRDFYEAVVGWKPEGVDMGGYQDFNMTQPATGSAVAGVCHARGVNAGFPAQWMIYV